MLAAVSRFALAIALSLSVPTDFLAIVFEWAIKKSRSSLVAWLAKANSPIA